MAEKRYYWLKLKENYFDSPKIKKLRRVAGGDTYTIIYLKMQLLSVSNEGMIRYEGIESTFEEELALKLDEDYENVKITLSYLLSQNLIESNDDQYLLIEASNSIGSEGQSAERKRQFDKRRAEKLKEMERQALLGNASVTQEKRSSISISNSLSNSISIEDNSIEEEKKQKEKEKQEKRMAVYKEIIDYLNEKTQKKYSYKRKDTQKHINARIKEGYTLEDFKKVIDIKCSKWLGNIEWETYLRPDTLFGNKFEGYLNECTEKEIIVRKEEEKVAEKQKHEEEVSDLLEKLRDNENGYTFYN